MAAVYQLEGKGTLTLPAILSPRQGAEKLVLATSTDERKPEEGERMHTLPFDFSKGAAMSITWGALEAHDECWERAKRELGVSDVRELTREQFRAVLILAEQLRREQIQKKERK